MKWSRKSEQVPGHHHFTECPMYDAKPEEVYTGPPAEATTASGVVCTCMNWGPF